MCVYVCAYIHVCVTSGLKDYVSHGQVCFCSVKLLILLDGNEREYTTHPLVPVYSAEK